MGIKFNDEGEVEEDLDWSRFNPGDALRKREYVDTNDRSAFIIGYEDGFRGNPFGAAADIEKSHPNAYGAGYWEGVADA